MANNTTLPGTNEIVEDIDIGGGVKRQVMTIGDRAGGSVDSIGGLTETAPASDTASSGLNGRLQRLAQRLTSLIALVPASLGAKTSAASFAVVLASDQAALPITDNSGSLTVDAPLATPLFATLTPNTTGGWTSANMTSADGATALTNTAQAIKAAAGLFGGYYYYNPNTAAVWIHIYNTAFGSVTVGTTNPQLSYCVGALSAANIEFVNGINFATAMSAAATSTAAGNGAPTTALEVMVYYK